jgi:DNA-binding NarL/FixJ family response regulator
MSGLVPSMHTPTSPDGPTPLNGKLTVMLVDDHAVVRAGYRLLLSQAGDLEVVGEAERGEEACQRYFELQPQVMVMDLSLPGIGGMAAIRRICLGDPQARILVFSIHDEPVYITRTLEAGAKGYISKSCPPDILVEAVRRVAAGQSYIEPELAQRMAIRTSTMSDAAASLDELSPREFDVFRLLAWGRTTREVAETLHMGHKTASNYSTTIKNKLGVNTTAELARLAYQAGVFKEGA